MRDLQPALPRFGLTTAQADVLRYIVGYQQAHGIPPSYREIARATGLSSHGRVCRMIGQLEERGRLRRLRQRARSVEVLAPLSVPSIDGQPLYFIRIGESSVADLAQPGAPDLRDLLSEALDLARRARELDAQVARALQASRGRCATGAAAIMQSYDRDLESWMTRAAKALRP